MSRQKDKRKYPSPDLYEDPRPSFHSLDPMHGSSLDLGPGSLPSIQEGIQV
jgi:hypothetical protein